MGWAADWGRVVYRHRWLVVAIWALAFLAALGLGAQTPRLLSPSGFQLDTEARHAADLIRQRFPERTGAVVFVVLDSDQATVSDPAYQAQAEAYRRILIDAIRGRDARVSSTPPSADGHTLAIVVASNRLADQFLDLPGVIQRARPGIHGPAAVYVGGPAAVYEGFIGGAEADLRAAEMESLPLAAILLLVVFGGLVAAGLPVLTGTATVVTAVAVLGLAARAHTVSVFALNISSALGIGLGIDYSLLMVNRFREEMRATPDVESSVVRTAATAGTATLVSGATVMIGFGALMLSRLNVLWSQGLGGVLVVGCSLLASLTLIPALLGIFGRHIDRLTLPVARNRDTSRFWDRLARGVMRRPLLFIVAALTVVGLLLWPARHLYLGVVGAESLPPADESFRAQALVERRLGFQAGTPVLIVADGIPDLTAAAELESRVRQAAGGRRVTGPVEVAGATGGAAGAGLDSYLRAPYAIVEVAQAGGDNDPATRAMLDRLRAQSWPPGVRVSIGGQAAAYQDYLNAITADFPKIVGVVVALTLLLLFAAFRSIALPLKAVLMNLLSVGAAMGVLTWGFQEGHLAGLLGFRPVGFVDTTVPMIVFAGLFGLSMDYEVFLLSRIREEYVAGLDNASAVARGMARTGQIITSAALILVVVAMTLATSRLTLNKALGVTFAAAILLDATLIRLLLVPAMMRVLGDLNWWPGGRGATTATRGVVKPVP